MRVISGTARGLKLKSPIGNDTRPTADRIKESLFNIINPYLKNATFLDLFSGSGSIGIEALSRGAEKVFFVDISKDNFNLINQNLSSANLLEKAIIYNYEAISVLDKLFNDNIQFDIIFMDPPYNKNLITPILEKIKIYNLLKNDGIIICEQHIDEPIPSILGLENYRVKHYKITKMTFFQNTTEDFL